MDNYSDFDGLGLAELVATKQVSPAELVEAAIARVERHDPILNAVVYKGFDDARARAKGELPDGPFKGVPFLIKDLAMPVAGWPRTSGSRFARNVVDAADGGLTARYRAAGVIPIGKSNTPEFGITGTTESAHLGPCRNPWNPKPYRRRLVGRLGRGGGLRHGAHGARVRRAGVDPHPGGVLWPGGPESHPRPQPESARRLRLRGRAGGRSRGDPHRARLRRHARRHRLSRAGLALCQPGEVGTLSPGGRPQPGPIADRLVCGDPERPPDQR